MNIAVVIVNYNSCLVLERMLKSANSLNVSPDIYIVDNNSTESLSSDFDSIYYKGNIKCIRFNANFGYFGAVAKFLNSGEMPSFDWLFIANPDLVFSDPLLFDYIVEYSNKEKNVGVYCPAIISAITGRDQNPFLLNPPTILYYYKYASIMASLFTCKAYCYCSLLKKSLKRNKPQIQSNKKHPMRIFAPHGAFLGFSKFFFEKGGFLESRNFLFYEEEIVGFIASAIGLEVVYDPRVEVRHEEHATTGEAMTNDKFLIKRNSLSILKEYILMASAASRGT